MKRLELSVVEYLRILDACKAATAKNDLREALRYIKLDVQKDTVTAVSLNGYVLARYTFKHKSSEEFTCFIRPVALKPLENSAYPVILEVENDTTILTMNVAEGQVAYTFKHPWDYTIDADRIIGEDNERIYKQAFDAHILAIALEGLKKFSRGYFVFNFPEDPNKPALLKMVTDVETVEQLVLPVRMYEGKV